MTSSEDEENSITDSELRWSIRQIIRTPEKKRVKRKLEFPPTPEQLKSPPTTPEQLKSPPTPWYFKRFKSLRYVDEVDKNYGY